MPSLSRDDWIQAAAFRLATHGVDQVRVEPLAKELGVSKGSFYWHFTDRAALLDAVLDMWESRGTEAIITAVDSTPGDPASKVVTLLRAVFSDPRHDGIELGIRSWAARDTGAAAVVARVDARRVTYSASLVEAAGVPAQTARKRVDLMYRALIGEFVLRSHGNAPLPQETLDAFATTLVRLE